MTALEYLREFPYLTSTERSCLGRPSVSELRRWLTKGSVVVNGTRPKPSDEIQFPIRELVFFPTSKSRVTIFQEERERTFMYSTRDHEPL